MEDSASPPPLSDQSPESPPVVAATNDISSAAPDSETPPVRLSRRRWLSRTGIGLVSAGIATASYAHWIEPHWVSVVRRDLPIMGLPPALEGKTLLQLSDLHVGPVVSDRFIIRWFQKAAALKPDLVVATGDFITYENEKVWKQVDKVYAHFPKGRLATLGCLGNHDYGQKWASKEIAAKVVDRLGGLGIEILRPGVRNIDGLTIAGLDDLWGSRWNRTSAMSVIPQSGPAIVLCHNPDACDIRMWGHYRGWILAGHTHGGQCRLPFMEPPIQSVMNRRYTAGEFVVGEGRRLYINRGLGHLTQVRFCVRPEITLFTLRKPGPAPSASPSVAISETPQHSLRSPLPL
jgi:predicted MPP superfamily phosphohydrolase